MHQFLDEVDHDDDNPFKLLPTTSADAGVMTEAKPSATPVTGAPVAAATPVASAKN